MQTIIDNITVMYDDTIALDELREYVEQEKQIWQDKGKKLASIDVKLCGDDVEITSHERSPIMRLRRITGYISKARQVHMR